MRIHRPLACAAFALSLACSDGAQAAGPAVLTYTFNPVADTTIFAGSDASWDSISDGAGPSLWVSVTAGGVVRRSLLRFDLSAIPAGQQVVSASLQLFETRSRDDHAVTMHRVLAGWGEGLSNAGASGAGAPATAGDATWRWRHFGDQTEWQQRGGDYVPLPSASTLVGPPGDFYTWASTPGLVSDVQGWLDGGHGNFGWMLIGSEQAEQNAKRFDSLQGGVPSQRPLLQVQVTAVPEAASSAMLAAGLLALVWLRRARPRA